MNIISISLQLTFISYFSYMFHVMVENGLIFMCAADTDFGRRQPYAYLTEVSDFHVEEAS